MKGNRKAVLAWCFYDWACSGFPIIVTTFIFATYFTSKIAINEITGTYQWANATAIAGVLIACLSPLFGAIADYKGYRKKWLFAFTVICITSSFLLWFAYPQTSAAYYTLSCVVVGTVSLEIAMVFYNAFLLYLADPKYIGRISGWAWGLGYFGGVLVLAIALVVFVKNPFNWFDETTAAPVRLCGPLVAVWFAIFASPLFLLVKDEQGRESNLIKAIQLGIKDLFNTLKYLPQQKTLALYLLAHLIYIDGLNTLFAFGGIYATGTFKMPLSEVILFGLSMNIAAGIGAVCLAWVDDYYGSRPTIIVSLIGLIILGFLVLVAQNKIQFWVLGMLLSLFLGPVQAASRSLMAHLSPKDKANEMFGLYAFSGRITAFIGPWFLGMVTLYTGSQRMGMSTVLLFFLAGLILMYYVKLEPVKH